MCGIFLGYFDVCPDFIDENASLWWAMKELARSITSHNNFQKMFYNSNNGWLYRRIQYWVCQLLSCVTLNCIILY